MDVCETCGNKLTEDKDQRISIFADSRGEDIYFCSEECLVEFAKRGEI